MIVHDHAQPWPDRLAVLDHENIEHGMIGLPHRVGRIGVAPMHEFVAVAIGRRIRRGGNARRFDPAHDPGHDRIARGGKALSYGFGVDLAMDGCRCWPRTPGCQAPHKGLDLGCKPSRSSGIAAPCPFQTTNAMGPPGRQPAMQGAYRNAALGRDAGQWNVLLQMGLQEPETREGFASIRRPSPIVGRVR